MKFNCGFQDGFAYALSTNTSGQSFADGGVAIAMLEQEGNKGPPNSESSTLQQAFYSGQQYLPNSNSAWTVPNKGTRSPEFNNGQSIFTLELVCAVLLGNFQALIVTC